MLRSMARASALGCALTATLGGWLDTSPRCKCVWGWDSWFAVMCVLVCGLTVSSCNVCPVGHHAINAMHVCNVCVMWIPTTPLLSTRQVHATVLETPTTPVGESGPFRIRCERWALRTECHAPVQCTICTMCLPYAAVVDLCGMVCGLCVPPLQSEVCPRFIATDQPAAFCTEVRSPGDLRGR